MNAFDASERFSRRVRAAFPHVRRASELPFPRWWKKQMAWFEFHAPRMGENLVDQFARAFIAMAKNAERTGVEPEAWKVPAEVKAIWEKPLDPSKRPDGIMDEIRELLGPRTEARVERTRK